MKCIIIDDEPLARKGIRILAEQVGYLDIIGEYSNPLHAEVALHGSNDIDLIFLDIEMPGMSGLEYISSTSPSAMIILTTAYSQYALEAFELDVLDYLVKPIKIQRFVKAVSKAREVHNLKASELSFPEENQQIFIKADRKYVKLSLGDIVYIKGLKDYVIIQTNTKKYMTAMNVGTIHSQLPSEIFARVSKSYIINVDKIQYIDTDYIQIGEDQIPLGNSYKEAFITNYVKGSLLSR